MPQELSHDLNQPWCLTMARDPDWKLIPTLSLTLHPASTENSLLAETLSTSKGVRAVQTYINKAPDASAAATTP